MPEQPPPTPPDDPGDPAVHAAFDDFAVRAALVAPPGDLPAVRSRAGRGQRSRLAVVAAASAALVVPVAVYALAGGGPWWNTQSDPPPANIGAPQSPVPVTFPALSPLYSATGGPTPSTEPLPTQPGPPDPTPGDSPTVVSTSVPPSSAPAGPISDVDWANATLDIPANQTGCAAGTAHFRQSVAEVAGTLYHLGSGAALTLEVAYGDVDADGRAEALLVISCITPAHRNPPALILLLGAHPEVHTMAVAFTSAPRISDGEGRSEVRAPTIAADGAVTFEIRTFEGTGQCEYRQRWTGTALSGACGA